MNTTELTRAMHDYSTVLRAGDVETAQKIESVLRDQLKTQFSRDYVDTLFVRGKTLASSQNPSEQIGALDALGYMIRSPGEWANPPENKGALGSFGTGFMQGLTGPFKRRFDEPGAAADEQAVMDAQLYHKGAVGAGQLLGGMIPEAAAAAVLSKVRPIQAMGAAAAPLIGGATGGAMGLIDPAQDPVQGAIAGAAGGVAGHYTRKAFSPKPSKQPEPIQELIQKQREKGYWAAPGYQSGSKAKQQLDHAIKKNPLTADYVDEQLQQNRNLLTQETARAIGIDRPPPTLSIEALDAQRQALNTRLDNIYASTVPIFSKQDRNTPAALARRYTRKLGENVPNEFSNFTKRYDSLVNVANTNNPDRVGPQLRTLVRDLSDRAHYHLTNPSGNKELGTALRGMLGTVETATGRRLGPDKLDEWKETRTQQSLLLDLVESDPELLSTGKVSPRALTKVIESGKSRNLEYIQRRRDLWDSARFISQQENAFENSLSAGQRFGHYLKRKQLELPTGAQTLADITKSMPVVHTVAPYLKGRYYRLPKDLVAERRAGIAGGILAQELVPDDKEYQFAPGILD